jgi:hypothetical protein
MDRKWRWSVGGETEEGYKSCSAGTLCLYKQKDGSPGKAWGRWFHGNFMTQACTLTCAQKVFEKRKGVV